MRTSKYLLSTLKETPADAEVISHQLMLRADMIRKLASGLYTWLPMGLRVLRKVEAIVREEMEAIGAQELSFPALLPKEPYEATNRWTEYGDNLFRLTDRKDAQMLLGPTHEEMFCLAVKDMYTSYKDLPLSIYQIQTKYRDEARPRAGLMRGREFVMKDSYSFDVDDAGRPTASASCSACSRAWRASCSRRRLVSALSLKVMTAPAIWPISSLRPEAGTATLLSPEARRRMAGIR